MTPSAELSLFPKVHRRSVSRQMFDQFKKNKTKRQIAATFYVVTYLIYLAWRATILNMDSFALSFIYFVAEIFGFVLGLTIILASRNYTHHEPPEPLQNKTVDVFVPTYKEPIEIIRHTAMAARDIKYPHKTWVLDDGRSEDVKALAAELGIHYLSRPQNTNAKAGNLNYGLANSAGEFVMVFDADHIALPHALDVTLGFFIDKNVSMVQTPQDYYNTDAFQYINASNGALWHDQSFFYNIAQSCRDSVNGSSCVGTGAVYRRSSLEHIGGVPTETVTEDIHTTLKLHKAGYRTIYLNEPIAYGEAAPDLKEYYKTRQRWGHGNLHALQHENALFCKGLTMKQRIAHISLGLIYLEGWQQLMLLSIPVCTLFWGLQPFQITIFNILVIFLFPFLSYILLQEIGCGFARFWPNEIFSMARWPVQILATVGAFGRSMSWHTSIKNIKARIHWRLMAPQIIVMLASVGAVIYATIRVSTNFKTGPLFAASKNIFTHGINATNIDMFAAMPKGYTVDMVMVAGFWALYNALRAAVFVIKVIRNAHHSHKFFRFSVPLPLRLKDGNYGQVKQVSEIWVDFKIFGGHAAYHMGDLIPLTLFLPSGELDVQIRVTAFNSDARNGIANVEGEFVWGISQSERDQLAQSLYSVNWHRELLHPQTYFITPLDFLSACFTLNLKFFSRKSSNLWQTVLYSDDHGIAPSQLYGMLSNNDPSSEFASFITIAALRSGCHYKGATLSGSTAKNIEFLVINEDLVLSPAQKTLDNSVMRRYRIQLKTVASKQLMEKLYILPPRKAQLA